MGLADVVWMALVLGGAGVLLYRSIGKSNGRCGGCDNAGCSRRTLCLAAPLLGCLVAPGSPSAATEPAAPPPADPARVSGGAEIYHTPAEKVTSGLASRLAGQVTFSGLLEVEASADSSGSGLALATAQLGLGVSVDRTISGTPVVLAEDGGDPSIDEATIDLAAGLLAGAGDFAAADGGVEPRGGLPSGPGGRAGAAPRVGGGSSRRGAAAPRRGDLVESTGTGEHHCRVPTGRERKRRPVRCRCEAGAGVLNGEGRAVGSRDAQGNHTFNRGSERRFAQ